jgi:hypothetical protein
MKTHIAIALLLALAPVAQAAVTSTANASPVTGTLGHEVTLSFTKTASYLDGRQNGTVTPKIVGPANATLAVKSYDFTANNPLAYTSATLTWSWTPGAAGNYTITFQDQAGSGTAATRSVSYSVTTSATGGGDGQVTTKPLVPAFLPLAVGVVAAVVGVSAFRGRASTRSRLARLGLALLLAGLAAAAYLWG